MTRRITVDVAGEDIAVAISDGSGAKVLLIHGAGGNYLQWPPHIRRLEGAEVYTLDLPGHGNSSGRSRSTVSEYAECVRRLLRRMELESVVIVGHSMGAAIAMTVAAQPETQIAGLGLLACGDTLPIPNEVPELLISSFETAVEQIVAASSSSQTSAKMRQIYKSHLTKSEPDVLRDDFVAARTFRAEPFAARLPIPTVILAGEEDAMVPTPRSRALHLLTPNSKLKVFSGAGHMLHWEREHETIQALQSLIQDM